jgi:hypothetical protein
MRSPRLLLFALALAVLAVAPAPPLFGDADPRVDPFGGIRWNDRLQDAAARMGGLSDGRSAEISITFPDRATKSPFGTRSVDPGSGQAISDAVSAIVRDYLDGMDASRSRGDDRIYRAFHLHVLGMLFDKSGQRHAFLDAEIRLTVHGVTVRDIPFDMTATFRANPGAGLTERYVLPVAGTKYVLPVVLTRVTLTAKSAAARTRYAEIDALFGKRYDGFKPCTVDGLPGRCDGRPASVAWRLAEDGAVTIRYEAEKYWAEGLDAVYREHLATVEGRSKRCHAKRTLDA